MLRAQGAEVTTASSAEMGLELLSKMSPMVLLSDVPVAELPLMEGAAAYLMKAIRAATKENRNG